MRAANVSSTATIGKRMKILITGNMGYVGPVVVGHLSSCFPDASLCGADTGFFAHCLTSACGLPERRLDTQHFVDVRELDAAHLDGVDAVIHLAAISNDPMGKAYEAATDEINHRETIRVARLAREAGVGRFVFASSCSVYGYAEGRPRDETSELNPLTAYARSKIDSEHDLEPLAGDGFVVSCLRFPTACGMSERLRLDLVLNDFVASAVATGTIKILSDGTPWRPLIDVKDMARAMEWAIVRPAAAGGDFLAINVGRNEWNYQVKDLAEAVRAQMPHVQVDINRDAQPDRRSYQVDFSRYAALAPDHLPQIDLARSIDELRRGLEAIDFRDAGFRESHYIRLKVLGGLKDAGALDETLRWRANGS